ncbi:MAG: HAMP domain-containing histidine kinase [Lewinellaceae bacterium]|nr:HAMP domain-containing histidine kinase [Lewinellaceae bacterium]
MKHYWNTYGLPLLMSSSFLLLFLFQGYWLQRVYAEQRENLHKELSALFFNTARDMQDEVIMKALQPMEWQADSAKASPQTSPPKRLRLDIRRRSPQEAVFIERPEKTPSDTSIQIFLRSEEPQPSVGRVISSVMVSIQKTAKDSVPTQGRDRHFNLNFDTLSLVNIQNAFADSLRNGGFPFEVIIRKEKGPRNRTESGPHFEVVAPAFIPAQQRFIAQITHYKPYLLRKVIPYAAFACFLVLLTGFSFFVVYRSLRQQQLLTRLKNDFISNISHELKTPITTVGVALEAMNNFNVLENPSRAREYLDISQNELKRLSILVDRVLKMSIFESKTPDLHLERFDLRQQLDDVLRSLQLRFDQAGASVDLQVQGNDFALTGDAVHLTNVIYNLLDNALKYSPEKPQISLLLTGNDQSLMLRVSDKGIGISPEYQARIFEKFFRVPTGDRHNTKGHGLGLSYVAGVIAQHHGQIDVQSSSGQGSTFTITLPRKHD